MTLAVRARPPSGAVLFARYAYPPNALGYCGPENSAELFERAAAGEDSPGLRRLIRGFDGAWPYLALIAGAAGRVDPLDPDVVEAYWVGNGLLDACFQLLLETVDGAADPEDTYLPSSLGRFELHGRAEVGIAAHQCARSPWSRVGVISKSSAIVRRSSTSPARKANSR